MIESGVQVLYMDDSADARVWLKRTLEDLGLKAQGWKDGAAFRRELDAITARGQISQVRLIVLDIKTLTLGGGDLLKVIMNNPLLEGIHVVAYSSEDESVARQLGFPSFISKSVRLEYLANYLRQAYDGKRVWARY